MFRRESDKARHNCIAERRKPVSEQADAVQCVICERWFRSRGGLDREALSSAHCATDGLGVLAALTCTREDEGHMTLNGQRADKTKTSVCVLFFFLSVCVCVFCVCVCVFSVCVCVCVCVLIW